MIRKKPLSCRLDFLKFRQAQNRVFNSTERRSDGFAKFSGAGIASHVRRARPVGDGRFNGADDGVVGRGCITKLFAFVERPLVQWAGVFACRNVGLQLFIPSKYLLHKNKMRGRNGRQSDGKPICILLLRQVSRMMSIGICLAEYSLTRNPF